MNCARIGRVSNASVYILINKKNLGILQTRLCVVDVICNVFLMYYYTMVNARDTTKQRPNSGKKSGISINTCIQCNFLVYF